MKRKLLITKIALTALSLCAFIVGICAFNGVSTSKIVYAGENAPWTETSTMPTESGNYVLQNDVQLTAQWSVATGEEIVLDLNGKTVNFSSASVAQIIKNTGALTVKDSSLEKTGEIIYTFTKSSGVCYGFHNQSGTLNLEGGKITVNRTAGASTVYGVYSGTINMTGGEVNVNSSTATTVNAISSSGIISGGKVNATAKTTANVCSNSTTRITGGTFNGTTVSASILGGTFNFNPDALVPAYTYETIDNADGTFSVIEAINPQMRVDVDGTEYVSVIDAINSASDGSTIKLLKEYDSKSVALTIPEGIGITFDLNGQTISGYGATLFEVKGAFTLIDSVGGGSINHAYNGTSATYTIKITTTEGQFTLNSGTINTNYNGTTNNLYVGSVFSDKKGSITINGGAINTRHNHLTASTGYAYGARATNTTLIMTGGEINVFCAKQAYGIAFGGNGSQMTGGTIIATSSTGSSIGVSGEGTIFGGTIKAIVEDTSKTANVVSSSSAVIVDGNFEGNSVSARVLGGTFNFNPVSVNANIPNYTHKVVDNKNGTFSVVITPQEELPKNIDVDGKQFATFDLAKDAISVGSKITLLNNYDGNKTAISIPSGITLDLNGKTITLDKSVFLNIAGGTIEYPTLITDSTATSHDDVGTVKALFNISGGYTNIEKINIDTTEIAKISTFTITGESSNLAIVNIKGVNIKTSTADSSSSYGDFTNKYAQITIDNLNDNFGFALSSNYKNTSTSYAHKIFQNLTSATVIINGGVFTLTENGADRKVYFAYNDNETSLLYIYGGEFYFNFGEKQITDVSLMWNRKANDSAILGGKFYTELTTLNSIGTSGYSSLVPTVIQGGIYNVAPRATALASGYSIVANTDANSNANYPYMIIKEPEVMVGGAYYDSIQLAINAMYDGAEQDREITLLKNIVLGSALVVKIDGITIIAGEYALNFPQNEPALTLADEVRTINGVDMTQFEAYRKISGGKNYYKNFSDAAKIAGDITLLKNVNLNSSVCFAYNTTNATLNLGEYTITSDFGANSSYSALFSVYGNAMGTCTLTVNATTGGITVNSAYVFHVGTSTKGNLIINGGSYIGALTCINMQNGAATINEGTFKIIPKSDQTSEHYNNYSFTVNCIDANRELCNVVINGGKFYKFNPADNASEGAGTNYVSNLVSCVYYEQNTEYYVARTYHVDQESDGACDNCGLEQIIIESFNGYEATFDNAIHQVGAIAKHSLSQTYGINYAIYRYVESEWVVLQDYTNLFTVKNVIDSGSYKVVASIKCGYLFTSVEQEFTVDITPLNVEGATITLGEGLTYNGKEQTQVVDGVVINGIQLIVDIDYYISNNTAINVASSNYALSVQGMGNYSGIAYKNWNINKASASIVVDTTPIIKTYGDVWTLPIATSNFGTVICDKAISDLVNAGEYEVKYEVLGADNYFGDVKTISIFINKATYDMSGILFEDKVFMQDGLEHSVQISGDLPSGVSVAYINNNKTEAGVYSVVATFIYDTLNYNDIQPMTATLTINKSQITASDGNNEGEAQQTPNVVVIAQNGFNPDVEVVFTKVDVKDVDAGDAIKDGEEIFAVYDISLIKDGMSIQPNGTITIKLLIPDGFEEIDYKIIHNHNGEFSQVEYEVIDGYAVFSVDKLSEFMFVYTPIVFPWYVFAFWGLCFICMTIALIAINKNKKN